MSSKNANWSVYRLWRDDPDTAEELFRAALNKAEGSIFKAAPLLGISYRSMYRWIHKSPNLSRDFLSQAAVLDLSLAQRAEALGVKLKRDI